MSTEHDAAGCGAGRDGKKIDKSRSSGYIWAWSLAGFGLGAFLLAFPSRIDAALLEGNHPNLEPK